MTSLAAFGALAVSAMLLFCALESRSPWFVIAFTAACLASSAHGFLRGGRDYAPARASRFATSACRAAARSSAGRAAYARPTR